MNMKWKFMKIHLIFYHHFGHATSIKSAEIEHHMPKLTADMHIPAKFNKIQMLSHYIYILLQMLILFWNILQWFPQKWSPQWKFPLPYVITPGVSRRHTWMQIHLLVSRCPWTFPRQQYFYSRLFSRDWSMVFVHNPEKMTIECCTTTIVIKPWAQKTHHGSMNSIRFETDIQDIQSDIYTDDCQVNGRNGIMNEFKRQP